MKGVNVMKSNPGEFYILQDGTQAAPGDCSEGKDGVTRHENGLQVLLDSNGDPLTVQKQAEEGGAAMAASMAANRDGEPLMTQDRGASPKPDEEKPVDGRPPRNRMSEAMMPGHAPRPDSKPQDKKAE